MVYTKPFTVVFFLLYCFDEMNVAFSFILASSQSMEQRKLRFRKKQLEELNDDELQELLADSHSGNEDDGDFSSGDELDDPSYYPDEIVAEEVSVENIEENEFIETVNLISISAEASTSTAIASTSKGFTATSTPFKPPKRARSPLPSIEPSGPKTKPTAGGFNADGLDKIDKTSNEFSQITWAKTNMKTHINDVAFRGTTALPSHIKSLRTPMNMFSYFFTDEILQIIVNETNRNAIENQEFETNCAEIRNFIGILMYMSIYRYPNLESYWGKNAFTPIQDTMPVRRFMLIKQYFSFQDESHRIKKGEPGYDPLFRIRSLADAVNERFDSIPKTARLCIDEQMCSTKIKHHLRQYMPNKPHKWGIKLFVLCDSHGFAYRFEIYNGAGDNVILSGAPDLGSTANIVVRLTQTVEDMRHHIIYFDNFYTSLPLLVYLRARGIYGLGTIRPNRIPNCLLPLDKAISNKPRGYSIEYCGKAYGVDISTVMWKDNKCVRLASTYVGIERFDQANPDEQKSKATRYDRKQKKNVAVDCPQIIREYNSHMGGVDLMDGLIGRYHIKAKSRDPMMRLFYHFVDMAATNAYILYRRINAESLINVSSDENRLLKLPEFREEIAAGLVAMREKRPVGRPSASAPPKQTPTGTSATHRVQHLVDDLRYDDYDHFPKWMAKGGRRICKLCKVSQTQCYCNKCKLHLCCSNNKNCFLEYHKSELE